MSSKHRAILRAKASVTASVEEPLAEDDEFHEDDKGPKFFPCLDEESDDGEDNDDSDKQNIQNASDKIDSINIVEKSRKKLKKNAKNKQTNSEEVSTDDLDFIEEITNIPSNTDKADIAHTGSCLQSLLKVESNELDVDIVLRKRFGGMNIGIEGMEGTNRKANMKGRFRQKKDLNIKRLVFGSPKEDWIKPPSYIGGGFGMEKCPRDSRNMSGSAVYFRYIWSDEYSKLYERYLTVQNSGDANMLVTFLSQNPYQVEGLLQLAMVFARTGNMDRAGDLVRRSIYCLESAFIEPFKLYNGDCRMDPNMKENSPLFLALFRHMQMTCMLGCPSIAANIARVLFSLDPVHDPMNVLLALDHFLLRAGHYQLIESFFFPIAFPLGIDAFSDNSIECEIKDNFLNCNIGHLPGWNFSRALSLFVRESNSKNDSQDNNRNVPTTTSIASDTAATPVTASSVIIAAVKSFPFVLSHLIEAAGAEYKNSSDWKHVLTHRYVTAVTAR